jgi:transposase InsO family protein
MSIDHIRAWGIKHRRSFALNRLAWELSHNSWSEERVQVNASAAYTEILKERGIRISMSRRGNAYDNAKAESFIKTLKYEEVYLFEYETIAEARSGIGHFLEEVYNQKRLHSALGYVPPAEFEQQLCQRTDA